MASPEHSSPLKYELEVEIQDLKFNDINSFMVFRCPIEHTASFAMIDLMLHITHYNHLTIDISQQIYPDVKLRTYIINAQKPRPENQAGERVKDLGVKNFIGIFIEPNEFPAVDAKYVQCTIYLVNPILYYLNNTNSYNVILTEVTGLEIITGYESHLKKTFGQKTFQFVKKGETEQQNSFKYEQILVRIENDLLIPSWAIQNYKPFNSFGFYFHDCFRLDDSVTADINCYLINLINKDVFTKVECLMDAKWGDVIIGNKFVNATPLGDRYSQLRQINASKIVKGYQMDFKFKKATGTTSVPNVSVEHNSQQIESGRTINSIKSTKSEMNVNPTEETLIYAPDQISTAIDRLNIVQKQISEGIEAIYRYYLRDSHVDFLQFGKLYNLNPMTPQEYLYTPINIVNCFVRDTGRQPTMVHNAYYQMIKYKGK